MSWINHLPPACWSTFWKSNFKQQLGCRFDIKYIKYYYFVFWHMQLYMSWYIRSFFGLNFLNILYFFKYSCTNIFHRRSLYTLHSSARWPVLKHDVYFLWCIKLSYRQAICLDQYFQITTSRISWKPNIVWLDVIVLVTMIREYSKIMHNMAPTLSQCLFTFGLTTLL